MTTTNPYMVDANLIEVPEVSADLEGRRTTEEDYFAAKHHLQPAVSSAEANPYMVKENLSSTTIDSKDLVRRILQEKKSKPVAPTGLVPPLVPSPYLDPKPTELEQQYISAGVQPPAREYLEQAEPEEVSLVEAFKKGRAESILGKLTGLKEKGFEKRPTIKQRAAFGAGVYFHDAPVYFLGSALGGGGVLGAAGAFALPSGVHKVIDDKKKDDLGEKFAGAIKETGKGWLTGLTIGTVGKIMPKGLKYPTEAGALATAPALLDGRLPGRDDIINALVLLGTLKGARFAGKMLDSGLTSVGLNRKGAYTKLHTEMTDHIHKTNSYGLSKAEADYIADILIKKSAGDTSVENLTVRELWSGIKTVRERKGKWAEARAETEEAKQESVRQFLLTAPKGRTVEEFVSKKGNVYTKTDDIWRTPEGKELTNKYAINAAEKGKTTRIISEVEDAKVKAEAEPEQESDIDVAVKAAVAKEHPELSEEFNRIYDKQKTAGQEDRRRDTTTRAKFEAMSKEEMLTELHTDPLTGLKNRRAYNDYEKEPVQASIDIDSLKAVNDTYGHDAGDLMIQTVGEALRSDKSIHISGDEFIVQGKTNAEVTAVIDKANAYLKEHPLEIVDEAGNKVSIPISFSYGVGKTLKLADTAMKADKVSRAKQGLRAERGEVPVGLKTEKVKVKAKVKAKAKPKKKVVEKKVKREGVTRYEKDEIIDVKAERDWAIITKDGKVVSDNKVVNHPHLIEKLNINPDDVADVGFVIKGKFASWKDLRLSTEREIQKFKEEELDTPQTITDTANLQKEFTKLPLGQRVEILGKGGIEPLDTLNQATIASSLFTIRELYKSNSKEMLEAVELHRKLKNDTITDAEIDKLFALPKDIRIYAGDLFNYANKPNMLFATISEGVIVSSKGKIKEFGWGEQGAELRAKKKKVVKAGKAVKAEIKAYNEYVEPAYKLPNDIEIVIDGIREREIQKQWGIPTSSPGKGAAKIYIDDVTGKPKAYVPSERALKADGITFIERKVTAKDKKSAKKFRDKYVEEPKKVTERSKIDQKAEKKVKYISRANKDFFLLAVRNKLNLTGKQISSLEKAYKNQIDEAIKQGISEGSLSKAADSFADIIWEEGNKERIITRGDRTIGIQKSPSGTSITRVIEAPDMKAQMEIHEAWLKAQGPSERITESGAILCVFHSAKDALLAAKDAGALHLEAIEVLPGKLWRLKYPNKTWKESATLAKVAEKAERELAKETVPQLLPAIRVDGKVHVASFPDGTTHSMIWETLAEGETLGAKKIESGWVKPDGTGFSKKPKELTKMLGEEAESRAKIAEEGPEAPKGKKTSPLKDESGAITISDHPEFYSKLEEVVTFKMRGTMDILQLNKTLRKNGVTDAEIHNVLGGLKGTVTKEQVLKAIEDKGTKFEDVILGEGGVQYQKMLNAEVSRANKFLQTQSKEIRHEASRLAVGDPVDVIALAQQYGYRLTKDFRILDDPEIPTKFSGYVEFGAVAGSYRELFVIAPEELVPKLITGELPEGWEINKERMIGRDQFVLRDSNSDIQGFGLTKEAAIKDYESYCVRFWQDGHGAYEDIRNPIIRIRFNERIVTDPLPKGVVDYAGYTDKGRIKHTKRVLFIEEMQGPSEANQAKMPEGLQERIYDIGVKRIITYAKEKGFDEIAITTGEMQVARYRDAIVKTFESLAWGTESTYGNKILTLLPKNQLGIHLVLNNKGNVIDSNDKFINQSIESIIGKDLARKIISNESGKLTGLDLEIGGEGLKRLYDEILPPLFAKYGREKIVLEGFSEFLENASGSVIGKLKGIPDYDIANWWRGLSAKKREELVLEYYMTQKDPAVPSILITPKTPKSFTMYSGLDPTQLVTNLKGLTENIREAMPYLEELGNKVYEAKDDFYSWKKKMQTHLGNMWNAFKAKMQAIWKAVKAWNEKLGERGSIGRETDKYLGILSTRLGNIDPSIKYKVRKYFYVKGQKASQRKLRVKPFIKKSRTMSAKDNVAFDAARKNGNGAELKRLVIKYKLGKEYHELRKVLDEFYVEAKTVGYRFKRTPNYHPREIKDIAKFLDYLHGTDAWSTIDRLIKAKEEKIKRYMTEEEKVKLVNSLLRGYSSQGLNLSKPGQLKLRKVKEVTPELDKFYRHSDSALLRYIDDMTEAIETHRLFGKKLPKRSPDLVDTLGGYVLRVVEEKKLNPSQERDLRSMLESLFNPSGPSRIVNAYRSVSYIDTMGSPVTAITQIGDTAWSLYNSGFYATGKAVAKSLVRQQKFTKKDLGVAKIAAEFSDLSVLAKALDATFYAVGLTGIDAIGKEALINSAYAKATKQAKNPKTVDILRKRLQPIFGEETNQLIKDFQIENTTENVKLYLFNVLSDFQPITLLEMPQRYVDGTNGRIFYMLKSYTIKMFDVYRRECFQKIKTPGTRLEGLKNLIKLSAYLVIMNATADVIQDLLLGRPIELADLVVDNIYRLGGASRFTVGTMKRQGVGTGLLLQILPPAKFINALGVDIRTAGDEKGLETVQSIPMVGKLYYWWFGKGAKKLAKKKRTASTPKTLKSLKSKNVLRKYKKF